MRSDSASSVKGYEVFFGFREPPFSLAPDTRFLFDSASHAAAREQVAYALERREPLVVVTGEIGTGKTLLCRSVVQKLSGRTFLSIVHDPMLDRDDLLKQVLQDFGVISKDRTRLAPTTRHELVHALQEFLLSLVPLQRACGSRHRRSAASAAGCRSSSSGSSRTFTTTRERCCRSSWSGSRAWRR